MKKTLLQVLLFTFGITLFAQVDNASIIAYRQAVSLYEAQEYGKALKKADDAIVLRKEQSFKEAELLKNSQTSRQVRAAGDKIEDVRKVFIERGEVDCVEVLDYYTEKKGLDFFNNSLVEMISYIESNKDFPEALKLIGDIFMLEGEYSVADEYYSRALSHADILDIPDEKYAILYQLADLSRYQGDYEKMEVRLLNVIGANGLSPDNATIRSIKNTVSQNKSDTLTKFFKMYRADNYYSLNAYCQLSEYYLERKEYELAFEYSSLSVITGFTKIYNLLVKRNLDYEFTDLASYFDEVSYNSDIIRWGTENNVWKEYYLFAKICLEMGYDVFASDLLRIIAKDMPVSYWQESAVVLLDSMDGVN